MAAWELRLAAAAHPPERGSDRISLTQGKIRIPNVKSGVYQMCIAFHTVIKSKNRMSNYHTSGIFLNPSLPLILGEAAGGISLTRQLGASTA